MFQHLELHRLRQRTVSLVSGHIELQILPLLFCFVFLKTAAACNITQGLEASVWKSNKFKQRCCSDKPESCHSFLLNKKTKKKPPKTTVHPSVVFLCVGSFNLTSKKGIHTTATVENQFTPTSEESGTWASNHLGLYHQAVTVGNKKNQLNEMMVGRRLLRRWEYSCRSWRGAAGQCTRRSRRCSCTLAPSAWRRRRKHWSGTGWGRPAYSASPTNTKAVERQG